MTRFSSLLSAAALAVAAPASAVQVVGIAAPGGNGAIVQTAAPSVLEADFAFSAFQPITLELELEPGDAGGIRFNSIVDVFTGVTLGQTLGALDVALVGGPTFAAIGDITGFFSSPVTNAVPGAAAFRILFQPAGEGVGLALGAPLGAGNDFAIAPGKLGAGERFLLVLSPAAVPEPATWAMMIAGFGLIGSRLRRRKAVALA